MQASRRCLDGFDLAKLVNQVHHRRVTRLDEQRDPSHGQPYLLPVRNGKVTEYFRRDGATSGKFGLDQFRVHPDGLVVDRKGSINLGQRKCPDGLLDGLAAGHGLDCLFGGWGCSELPPQFRLP